MYRQTRALHSRTNGLRIRNIENRRIHKPCLRTFSFNIRGYQNRSSHVLLKCVVAGVSAAAVALTILPQARKGLEENLESSPRTHLQETDSSLESLYKFPKNLKKLITDNDDKRASMSSTTEETRKLPWKGLNLLRSSLSVEEIMSAISGWSWPASFAALQEKTSTLILELSGGQGSLFSQVVNEPADLSVHPECQWDAEVRLGDDLCLSERAFLRERKRKMAKAFARLFGVPEGQIDERDLPIVAIAGSGGGFRAMVNTIGSLIGAKKSGLLDCVTYLAGTSGSCWALGVIYSGVSGSTDPERAARHTTSRIETSYLDLSTLDMLINPPTNKYLLSGLLRKASGYAGTVSLVDLYGTLISGRLFVPDDLSRIDERFLSLYHFRNSIDNGSMPMPIFTAVRHEIPTALEKPLENAKEGQARSVDADRQGLFKRKEEEIEQLSSWLWFEFTPFEVGCDELGAWIPTWSLGRRFQAGKSIERKPELSFSILSGIYASAFCASLRLYFDEIQPLLRQLPRQLYGWLKEILMENSEEFGVIHPVPPNELPNFVRGMSGLLRENSPPDITERETLGFLDAGALLNIPYYPLLRRDVDCIIALDASADSQDLWFTRAEQYAARRGLRTWPKGARWPALLQSPENKGELSESSGISDVKDDSATARANRTLAEAQEREASGQARKVSEPHGRSVSDTDKNDNRVSQKGLQVGTGSEEAVPTSPAPLSACTIWIGSSTGSQEESKMEELEEASLAKRDGIAVVYNPLIPNQVVPDYDPMAVSTWLFSMEKEETDKLLSVAEANFSEGRDKIIKLLRIIWLRKKAMRESRENNHRIFHNHMTSGNWH